MKAARIFLCIVLLPLLLSCSSGYRRPKTLKLAVYSYTDVRPLFESWSAEFEKREGWKVEIQFIPWAGFQQKILTLMAANQAPDVLWVESAFFDTLQAHGALQDLQPLVERDRLQGELSKFMPAALERYHRAGGLYALPSDVAPIACLYYNAAMFQAAGIRPPSARWTWDDLLKAALKLTQRDARGRTLVYGFKDNYGPDFPSWVLNNGGAMVDDPANPSRCLLDSPHAIQAATFLAEMQFKHGVYPMDGSRSDWTGNGEDAFVAGKLAMLRSGYWISPALRRIQAFDWDMAPFPKGPSARASRYAAGGSGWAIGRDCVDRDKAWELVKLLASEGAQRKMLEILPYTQPARLDLARSDAFLKSGGRPLHREFLLSAAAASLPPPAHKGWNEAYERHVVPKLSLLWRGEADPAQVLKEAAAKINQDLFKEPR